MLQLKYKSNINVILDELSPSYPPSNWSYVYYSGIIECVYHEDKPIKYCIFAHAYFRYIMLGR